jgi:hypothetical protein
MAAATPDQGSPARTSLLDLQPREDDPRIRNIDLLIDTARKCCVEKRIRPYLAGARSG